MIGKPRCPAPAQAGGRVYSIVSIILISERFARESIGFYIGGFSAKRRRDDLVHEGSARTAAVAISTVRSLPDTRQVYTRLCDCEPVDKGMRGEHRGTDEMR